MPLTRTTRTRPLSPNFLKLLCENESLWASSLRMSPKYAYRFRSWGLLVQNAYDEDALRIQICQLKKTIVLTTWHHISFETKLGALKQRWLATPWLQWSKIDGKPVIGGRGRRPQKNFLPQEDNNYHCRMMHLSYLASPKISGPPWGPCLVGLIDGYRLWQVGILLIQTHLEFELLRSLSPLFHPSVQSIPSSLIPHPPTRKAHWAVKTTGHYSDIINPVSRELDYN